MVVEPKHLISPNVHVILVHFPLGIFVFGVFLELFSFLWRRSTVRIAARWMILIGGLCAVPAALTGIDAYAQVSDETKHVVRTEGMNLRINGLDEQQWNFMRRHILLASLGAGLAAITVTVGLGLSDLWRRRLYFLLLAALVAAALLMTFGSHFGGEGVYLQSVGVKLLGAPATGIEWWMPARSTHILTAGLAMAIGLGALGASLRVLSMQNIVSDETAAERELEALTGAPAAPAPRRVTDDLSVARTLNADAELTRPRIPAGRFWLLSSLLFLCTLGLGTWFLISVENSTFDLQHASASTIGHELWQTATATQALMRNKRGLHIGLGIVLVILPLLLAIAVRFMARAKWLVGGLCLLMALAIAAELWIGILLIFHGAEGPIYRFSAPENSAATAMVLFPT